MATNNFLKYSGMTYSELISQINDRLLADSRFDNFRESAIAQMLIEIFAGATDIVNYYLDRRAEECYFDTARLRSSAILLSRQLGYVVTRAVPASTTIKTKIAGDLSTLSTPITSGDKLQVPVHSVFSYNGNDYILKQTFTHTFTQSEVDNITVLGENFELEISTDDNGNTISLAQGELKEKVIDGSTNPSVGQIFQVYKIEDDTFSNIYGTSDYDIPTTRVWVGNNKTNATEYDIDRRSLINWESLESLAAGTSKDVCVIRTSTDEDVEILFGDNQYASVGAATNQDNIFIQYLSTVGSKANEVGVIGQQIEYEGQILDQNGQDITEFITFEFVTNITGGADMESLDSIKNNAPAIYYSLDRLVTKTDYIAYLKSLTTPINIQNALAWGEQEEVLKLTNGDGVIEKLFNVVMFSCLGELYNISVSEYFPYTQGNGLENVVLDADFDEDAINAQSYFNLYIRQDVVKQLNRYEVSASYWWLASSNPSTNVGSYYEGQYGDSAVLEFDYTSDTAGIGLSASATSTVDMTTPSYSTFNTVSGTMTQYATDLTTALTAVTDNRGDSTAQNSNYGSPAFPGIECTYNSIENRLEIRTANSDVCYISNIRYSSATNNIASDTGLSAKSMQKLYEQTFEDISDNTLTVINSIQERSQVTTRAVYISPIIHNLVVSGTVYVNNLYDRESLRTELNNDVYEWLNINADFNEDIYKSNIIEIIEDSPGIRNVDMNFGAVALTPPAGYSTFSTAAIVSEIDSWPVVSDRSSIETIFIAYVNSITTNPTVTSGGERWFLETWAKGFYDTLVAQGYTSFADSTAFINLVTAVHKDFSVQIKNSLIDSQGNITNYTIGNEIVKLTITLSYVYAT